MTFKEKYDLCKTWHEKVLVMGLFHVTAKQRDKVWTVKHTAKVFDCSVGLVSENIQLADMIQKHEQLLQSVTRKDALKLLKDYK